MDVGCVDWMKKIRPMLPKKLGRILDIGSLNINGSAREYFKSREYLGIDMQAGKDVDIQMNAHQLMQAWFDSWDIIICMNTFEHDDKWWITLENINKYLKRDGYFIWAAPTYAFPIHKHPKDYYRFLEDSVREVVMKGFKILDIEEVYSKRIEDSTYRKGWRGINPIWCCLGQKI
jgi:hypothetical protein